MTNPKIWYVSFENPQRRRGEFLRSTESCESEEEAKQFAREALVSGKPIYAGTINPHTPKLVILPDKIEEWLNAV